MSTLLIEGGHRLQGRVAVEGNKNAALPLLAACLLTEDECVLTNVPRIGDVEVMARLLLDIGAEVDGIGSFTLQVVPRLTGFSNNNDFAPGVFIRLIGSGFTEGDVTVNFGATAVADPDGGAGTINVQSTGTLLDVNIPASPGGAVTVTTAGGVSNSLQVGPASFTAIAATASAGSPANAGVPSANPVKTIVAP